MLVSYLHAGEWEIDANGATGRLAIACVDELGRVSGTLFDQRITGWWSERARRLSFLRGELDCEQAYEGYAWDEVRESGDGRAYYLAGSFETFGGGGGANDRQTFGWFAALRGRR
jgi:hypothetical protein